MKTNENTLLTFFLLKLSQLAQWHICLIKVTLIEICHTGSFQEFFYYYLKEFFSSDVAKYCKLVYLIAKKELTKNNESI